MVDFAKLNRMTPEEREELFARSELRSKPVFVSPSQLDHFELCERKWAFSWIDKVPKVEKAEKTFGTDGHAIAENWLKNGTPPPDTEAGACFKQGLKFLPAPHPNLIIEDEFDMKLANNIHLIGKIDLTVPPSMRPERRPLITDHKFTKSLKWRKTEEELRSDPQNAIYSVYAMEKYNIRSCDTRWVYYASGINSKTGARKPAGSKATEVTNTPETLAERWDLVLVNAKKIAEYKRTPGIKAADIPPEPTACTAYGGCDYRDICKIPKGSILASHIARFNRLNKNHPAPPQYGVQDDIGGTLVTLRAPASKNRLHKTTENDSLGETQVEETEQMGMMDALANKGKAGGKNGKSPAAAPKNGKSPAAAVAPKNGAVRGKINEISKQKGARAVNPPRPEVEEEPIEEEVEAAAEEVVEEAVEEVADDQAPEESEKLIVLFNALPQKGTNPATLFSDIIAKVAHVVCEENELAHWNVNENGPTLLALTLNDYLDENPVTGVLVVDGSTPEARAVKEVLYQRADIVIQGIA